MTVMNPLVQSWAVDDLEQELKDLFIQLYTDELLATAEEINVYGNPHLGSRSLVERSLTQDGLAVIRDYDVEEYKIRYLFNAFRYRNPERGLHFLRTYLRVLYSDSWSANQLWQKKSDPYPTNLKTKDEIIGSGGSLSDYYLTSRVLVDLDTGGVPDTIIQSLKSSVPARFLMSVRIARFFRDDMIFGGVAGASGFMFASGEGSI